MQGRATHLAHIHRGLLGAAAATGRLQGVSRGRLPPRALARRGVHHILRGKGRQVGWEGRNLHGLTSAGELGRGGLASAAINQGAWKQQRAPPPPLHSKQPQSLAACAARSRCKMGAGRPAAPCPHQRHGWPHNTRASSMSAGSPPAPMTRVQASQGAGRSATQHPRQQHECRQPGRATPAPTTWVQAGQPRHARTTNDKDAGRSATQHPRQQPMSAGRPATPRPHQARWVDQRVVVHLLHRRVAQKSVHLLPDVEGPAWRGGAGRACCRTPPTAREGGPCKVRAVSCILCRAPWACGHFTLLMRAAPSPSPTPRLGPGCIKHAHLHLHTTPASPAPCHQRTRARRTCPPPRRPLHPSAQSAHSR